MSLTTVIAIAQRMIQDHDDRAVGVAVDMARDLAKVGDGDAAGFWYQVACAVQGLRDDPPARLDGPTGALV
jgi:hypothetical protein